MLTKYCETLQKRWKIKQPKALLFLFYFWMVYWGKKRGYLIDHIGFKDVDMLLDVITYTTQYWHASLAPATESDPNTIMIVVLGHDYLIVNRKSYLELLTPEIWTRTAIMNLNIPSQVTLLTPSESQQLQEKFVTLLNTSHSEPFLAVGSILTVDTTTELFQELGGPLIAGLFIGYPCLYWASLHDGRYQEASNTLSHRLLRKYSVVVSIEDTPSIVTSIFIETLRLLRIQSLLLYEFTVPVSLSSSSDVEEEYVLQWFQMVFEEFHRGKTSGLKIRLIPTEIFTESISL